ncbi:MAG: oligoendopeptidase F [Bacillota bacterium]
MMLKKSMGMKGIALSLVFVMIFSCFTVFAEDTGIPRREDIDPKYKWNLQHIYPTDTDWENDYKKLEAMIPTIEQYKGKLGASFDMFYNCLKTMESMLRLSDKLTVYAWMKSDEDTANDGYLAMGDRADALSTKVKEALSFIDPEILNMDEKILRSYMERNELQDYDFYIEKLLLSKQHMLSGGEERILALASDLAGSPEAAFRAFRSVDRKINEITDEDGKAVKLTPGNYSLMLENPQRDVRKRAFETEFNSYKDGINTLAATLSGEVKGNIFFAKARKYNSALEAALAPDFIEPKVYNSLIEAVNNNLAPLHRYVTLRKKLLGIEDKVHYYDMYVPMVEAPSSNISYEDGKKMMMEALNVLGEDYIKDLEMGLNSGWVDVYETDKKRSGAYSWGSYDTHPYVLHNYNGSLDAVSTLAHEMGHALNSYYSNKKQPYSKADYPIFTAEVASTTNEALMLDYLIKKAKTKEEKLYLINYYLELIRGTIYTQLMYAEFEKTIHEAVESGEALNATYLNEAWGKLMTKYYGEDFEVDELVKMWWARIPHFYYNFYVYKYATGLSAGIILSENMNEKGESARNAYLDFLAAGGSDYPVEMLKAAGVDMSTTEPVEKALDKFDQLLDEFERILNEK